MTESVKREIRVLLGKVIGMDEAAAAAMPDDIVLHDVGLTSLKFVEFIVAFEETYHVEVYDSDLILSNFKTLASMFETFDKYLQNEPIPKLYKCVITDCDGVLWHGIAGECGLDHSILDDGTRALQKVLKALRQRGVYLCICTKNSLDNICSMLEDSQMPLDLTDFAILETDVSDKSESIRKILSDLSLSQDSVIFLDDSAYECGLVETLLPEITVMQSDTANEWFLSALTARFDYLQEQALDRTRLYREQKEREKVRISAVNAEDYNHQLQTCIVCGTSSSGDAPRIAELSQRTNRFNMSGRRYTREEVAVRIQDASCTVLSLSVSDIYGDMGLVAAAIVCKNPAADQYTIENFMLSCRVLDRGFENILIEKIKALCAGTIMGIYRETVQNREHRNFYTTVGIEVISP